MAEPIDRNAAIIREFRSNSGKVGGPFAGATLLLLHTLGRKSGRERVNPVAYVKDGERMAIIASKGGAPENPDWFHNLTAHPEVTVEVDADTFRVRASVAEEPERTRLYEKMTAMLPGFAEYQRRTERVIPVIVLTRIS
jgi:deazaflavin-dependent oxidoreductase (nitroreductase family)